jgi:Ricin-type beta-trefoil lectin domain
MRENRYASTREGDLMDKRAPWFRLVLMAGAAILVGGVAVPASASTSATQATPGYAPPPGSTYVGQYIWQNDFNDLCLDGRLGTGNVTLQTCFTDGTHQAWNAYQENGARVGDYYLQDVFNGWCLDGRLGTGNVTLQTCGSDGTHQIWLEANNDPSSSSLTDQFNGWQLDGREGTGNVTVQKPESDGAHELWYAS